MNKDTKIYLTLVVIIIIIIMGVYYWKNLPKEPPQEATMKCIASKAVLYSSPTCSHCKKQKEILGDYFSLFINIDCFSEPQKCNEKNIEGYPTWIIDGKLYPGVKSIPKLAELTGCECSSDLINNTDASTCNTNETCITSLNNQCNN